MSVPGQQILDFVGIVRTHFHFVHRELDIGFPDIEGAQIDGNEDHVVAIGSHLPVEQDVVVVSRVKAQVLQLVKRRVFPADPVDLRDVVLDVAGPVPVPDLVVVFLRIVVLLAPRNGVVLA